MAHGMKLVEQQSLRLADLSTRPPDGLERAEADAKAAELGDELEKLQDLLYFAGCHGVLIVLQGMDTAGKDGAIRFLLSHTNSQSVRTVPFKVPTPEELSHDFLWRCHRSTPGRGEVAIFNRSHYEDVLVVRVHDLVPKKVWKERYDHIRNFEQLLADSGTIIFKFFLHISKDEQEKRLLEREQDPEKSWKLSVGDWKERELWDDYQEAYEDAIGKTAEKHAPWFVVPSDAKWYRNLVIAQRLVDGLSEYVDEWKEDLVELGKARRAELAAYRRGG